VAVYHATVLRTRLMILTSKQHGSCRSSSTQSKRAEVIQPCMHRAPLAALQLPLPAVCMPASPPCWLTMMCAQPGPNDKSHNCHRVHMQETPTTAQPTVLYALQQGSLPS
jgi:hypothetical protein